MSAGDRIPLQEARNLAADLILQLLPQVHLAVAAGSIRRESPTVGDIEIVAIPRSASQPDLFGGQPLDRALLSLQKLEDIGEITKDGPRYKQFTYCGRQIDLFLSGADRYGLILAIRTGPANWSHQLVKNRYEGGWMPNHQMSKDGALWECAALKANPRAGAAEIETEQQNPAAWTFVPTPTEEALFAAIGIPKIPPRHRG
jgi:hypothetical protein